MLRGPWDVGLPMKFIAALNSLSQPWVALTVIVLGMTFDVICQHYQISNDAATGVIGAGVGLLTGQAIRATAIPAPEPPAVTPEPPTKAI